MSLKAHAKRLGALALTYGVILGVAALSIFLSLHGREEHVNTPPAKAGGFGLRLEAGLIGHAADSQTTLKSSSGSGGFWFLMYSFHTSSVTFPLVATQYPRAHKC